VQAAHRALLVILPVVLIDLATALQRARRRGVRSIALLRVLARCAAMATSLVLAEGTAALWLGRSQPLNPRLPARPAERPAIVAAECGDNAGNREPQLVG
jgi:hypothetical protein